MMHCKKDAFTASLVCLNTFLIFSLNFMGIFANGPPQSGLPEFTSDSRQSTQVKPWNTIRTSAVGLPSVEILPSKRPFRPSSSDGMHHHHTSSVPARPPGEILSHEFFAQNAPIVVANSLNLSLPNVDMDLNELIPQGALPPGVTAEKLIQNSIDRFDAYGDYDYIDLNQSLLKPVVSPSTPAAKRAWHPVHSASNWPKGGGRNPYATNQGMPHWPSPPRRHDQPQKLQNSLAYHQAGLNAVPLSHFYSTTQKPGLLGSLLELIGQPNSNPPTSDFIFQQQNQQQHHPQLPLPPPHHRPGLTNQFLSFVGLKAGSIKDEQQKYQTNFGNQLEYEYGDYQEGQVFSPTEHKQLSIPHRVIKWFDGFKIPDAKKKAKLKVIPPERNQNGIDYESYETGDDFNIILYDKPGQQSSLPAIGGAGGGQYDFADVVASIKNNETAVVTFKKVLSAAAALSDRSDSNPVFMMWTVPTTLFAILGIVYFIGAIIILTYKSSITSNSSPATNGALLATGVALFIPIFLALVFVVTRATINGQLNINQVMRGDIRNSMRQDFDGVDFVMDTLFGAASILGIGWIISVTV